MLQLRLVVVITAGVVTVALGAAALFYALPALVTAVASAAVLFAVRALVRHEVHSGRWFTAYRWSRQQDAILRCLTLAGLWRASWLVGLSALPEHALPLALGLLGAAWVEYLAVDPLGKRIGSMTAPRPVEQQGPAAAVLGERTPQTRVQERATDRFSKALGRAGYPYLHVTATEMLSPTQQLFTVQVPSRVLAEQQAAEAAIAAGLAPSKQRFLPFGESAAEPIGIALGEIIGRPFQRDWIVVQPTENSGEFHVIVMTRNVLASVLVYEDDLTTPRSGRGPVDLGLLMTGAPFLVPPGHVEIIAQSGAGKTNLLFQFVAHFNACGWCDPANDTPADRVVVWIGGRRKQYESWGAYLMRYMNTGRRLPVDFLVNGQADTVNMLLAALLVMEYRQAIPHEERGALPRLAVIIDEYQDISADNTVVVQWRGQWWNASQLDAALTRGAKSAGIDLIRVMHGAVKTAAGVAGAAIKAAFNTSIMLRSNDRQDAGRATGDYRAKPMQHAGELLASVEGGPALRAKAKYMQEINKPTAPQTGGIPIPDVGWARRDMISELDPGSAAAAGDFYAARHQYMTVQFRDYLRGVEVDEVAAPIGGGSGMALSRADRVRAEARASIDRVLGRTSTGTTAVVAPAPVPVATQVEPRATLRDRTLDALRQAEGEVGLQQLVDQLGLDDRQRRSLQNLLTQLVKDEVAERPPGTTGVYRLKAAAAVV